MVQQTPPSPARPYSPAERYGPVSDPILDAEVEPHDALFEEMEMEEEDCLLYTSPSPRD